MLPYTENKYKTFLFFIIFWILKVIYTYIFLEGWVALLGFSWVIPAWVPLLSRWALPPLHSPPGQTSQSVYHAKILYSFNQLQGWFVSVYYILQHDDEQCRPFIFLYFCKLFLYYILLFPLFRHPDEVSIGYETRWDLKCNLSICILCKHI